jgi:hypothetical protein
MLGFVDSSCLYVRGLSVAKLLVAGSFSASIAFRVQAGQAAGMVPGLENKSTQCSDTNAYRPRATFPRIAAVWAVQTKIFGLALRNVERR